MAKEGTNPDRPMGLQERVYALFEQQLRGWELASGNYAGLKQVHQRFLTLGRGVVIGVQHNPWRITSSAARVDQKSVSERKCFLCPAHLPPQQRGVSFGADYLILVNPFPIFTRHLTIPLREHLPQRIAGRMAPMLALARELDDFVVFYNGPGCGASAPDHFHFQAGNKGFLPIGKELDILPKSLLRESGGNTIWSPRGYGRPCLVLEGADDRALCRTFEDLLALLPHGGARQEEPMLNVLAWEHKEILRVAVFPRRAHRPWQFYAEGDDRILLSPASVDMGGMFIIPREQDFPRIGREVVKDVFEQVCPAQADIDRIIRAVGSR